ncbi:MAG TPA: ISNCY family transposase [Vicinamibacterales bacterium]|jgi:IS5 family transposase|nr:ISNCY family transposase [Vicinamibacterales bacterium]
MVRRRQRERSLFEVLLPDGHKLWPEWLRRIDTLLEDEAVIETVAQAMEARWPQSRRRGRLGTPADVVLRMLILKHLFDWSYDDLEREVRANLVYRAFTRIDAGEVPDAKTILKIARALGPDVIDQLHRQVVDVAKRAGVTHGRRFRIDTTVVETNVHYPTDSSLLQDGVRVLTRTMQRASAALGDAPGRVRNRLRSVGRRVLAIGQQARSPKTKDALVRSYRKLMATTRAVMRDATTMVRRINQRLRTAAASTTDTLKRARQQLQQLRPVVERVLAQTRARVVGGDTHVPDKVLSIFEPHTEAIRKGKIAKPTEFGKLVTIQECEHQIITAYEVHHRRPADMTLWTPALDRHIEMFDRPPDIAAGDRGFASAKNEEAAVQRGVRRVILPRPGGKTPARRAHERQRWFRRGQRWRVGCEGRISVIKRRHGLRRCRYRGADGTARWVGLGVIANNLVSTATFLNVRASR